MSPGAFWLWFRTKFKHGVRAAWYRDIVRPRVLSTPPVACDDASCEIHVLTSEDDWLNMIWALKSFYHFSGRAYSLCIHDDGTLTSRSMQALRGHFPQARILTRAETDSVADQKLRNYARCAAFRNTNQLSLKLIDMTLSMQSDRLLIMDSDVLFFQSPDVLLNRIEDPNYHCNTFNSDFDSAYTITPGTAKDRLNIKLHEKVNSGLGLLHRSSLRLDWIEEFLGVQELREGHFWRIEQTLFALLSSRHGVELLPDPYTLTLKPGAHQGRPFRHYVGAIRHLMYREGIPELVSRGFLASSVGSKH